MYIVYPLPSTKMITAYRSAVLDNNIVIGRETAIGDNTIIRNSVIGNNCTLGEYITHLVIRCC